MHYSDILKRDIIEKERKKMRIKNNKNVRKGYDNLIILSLFKIAYGVNLLNGTLMICNVQYIHGAH